MSSQHRFENVQLLEQALTHPSYAHERGTKSNQVFEFLGDSVLELIATEYLVERYKMANEGELSKRRSTLVNRTALAKYARKLRLDKLVLLGKGENTEEGRQKDSILADTFEAYIAAAYLDGGLEAARPVLIDLFESYVEDKSPSSWDYKTELQEAVQSRGLTPPQYRTAEAFGLEHSKIFKVYCTISTGEESVGLGTSKKLAEQQAAYNLLKGLKNRSSHVDV